MDQRSVWSNLHALSPIMRFCIGHHWTRQVTTYTKIWRVSTTLSISSNLFCSTCMALRVTGVIGRLVPGWDPTEAGTARRTDGTFRSNFFNRLVRVYPWSTSPYVKEQDCCYDHQVYRFLLHVLSQESRPSSIVVRWCHFHETSWNIIKLLKHDHSASTIHHSCISFHWWNMMKHVCFPPKKPIRNKIQQLTTHDVGAKVQYQTGEVPAKAPCRADVRRFSSW